MIDRNKIRQYTPTLLFLVGYTALFGLVCLTFQYTFPFLMGFLLALLLQPFMRLLNGRLHFKKSLASLCATLLLYLLLFGLLFWAGAALVNEISELLQKLSSMDFGPLRNAVEDALSRLRSFIGEIDADFISQNKDQILSIASAGVSVVAAVLSWAVKFLTSIPAIFTMFLVMIFSTYFFAKDMPRIKRCLMSPFTDETALQLGSAAKHGVSMLGKYVSSYLVVYFITFLESLLVFFLLGVPYPVVLSIITGIADIIPILGPGTVYLPLAAYMLFQGNYVTAVALVIAWLAITLIREIIEPKIVSSSIEVHPLCMLAALYFALVSGNFLVLIYFTLLFVFYQILKKVGILHPLFTPPENKEGEKENKGLYGRLKNAFSHLSNRKSNR